MPGYRKNSLRLKRSKTRIRNKSLKNKNKRKTANKKRKISRRRKTQYGGSAAATNSPMLNIIREYISTNYKPKPEKSEKEGFMKISPVKPLRSNFIDDLFSYVKEEWSGIQLINDPKKNTDIKEIETLLNGKIITTIGEIQKNGSDFFILEFKEKEKDISLIFMTEKNEKNVILKVKLLNPELNLQKLNLRNPGIIGPIDLFSL